MKRLQQTAQRFGAQAQFLTQLLDGRTLRHIPQKELLLRVAKAILHHHDDRVLAQAIIQDVISPLAKQR